MGQLPEPNPHSKPPYWDYWRHDLWTRARTEPPENFTEWPCIRHTMLVDHFRADVRRQYYALPQEWRLLCRPPVVGRKDLFNDTNLSMNMINLAYHFWLYERVTGVRIKDLGVICEWGGGFGAQALLARRAGFRGRYFIFDLPEFRILQDWFLAQHGEYVSSGFYNEADLFLAIYSISEMEPEERMQWLEDHKSYLLLFSSRFAEYDNVAFFASLAMKESGRLRWHTEQFFGRPDHYLVGWQRAGS